MDRAGGTASPALRNRAAIFGEAEAASSDQPATSRILMVCGAGFPSSVAISSNVFSSCVQATSNCSFVFSASMAAVSLSCCARHKDVATFEPASASPQAASIAAASSGMLFPQLHNIILVCGIVILDLWASGSSFDGIGMSMMQYWQGMPNGIFHDAMLHG